MAESLRPWIAKCLMSHDSEYGADLEREVKVGRYAQITQFDTYRTPASPHAQITGIISDQSNWVPVTFDIAATDDFERPKHGVQPESLTSHLRAIIAIRRFRWRLAPPRKRKLGDRRPMSRTNSAVSTTSTSELDLPVLWMDILEWEVRAGDRNEPVYYPEAVEVGRGKVEGVGRVQGVLRKWWTGESNSDPSQPTQEPGPSRRSPTPDKATSPRHLPESPRKPQGRITLIEYVEPFLLETGKRKAIPDWLFDMPDGVQEQLDEIEIFGVDVGGEDNIPRAGEDLPPDEEDDEALPGRSPRPTPPSTGMATLSLTAPPPGQLLPSTISSASHPSSTPSNPIATPIPTKLPSPDLTPDDDDDKEEETFSLSRDTAARTIRDPLAFGRSEARSYRSRLSDDGETDEDMLSDWEKQRRKARLAENPPPTLPNGKIMPPAGQPTPRLPDEDEGESYSLSASNASREKDMSLSKYATVPVVAQVKEEEGSIDEAVDQEDGNKREVKEEQELASEERGADHDEVQQELSEREDHTDEEDVVVHGKREKQLYEEEQVPEELAEEDGHDADDEEEAQAGQDLVEEVEEEEVDRGFSRKRPQDFSDDAPTKRPRLPSSESETPRRSVLSYLNPLNLLRASRGLSGSPRPTTAALPDPPETVGMWAWRNRGRSTSTASKLTEPTHQRGEESFPTPERTASPEIRTAGDALRKPPGDKGKGKGLPTPTTSPLSTRSAGDALRSLSPKKESSFGASRKRREPKLGGWKPDFSFDGLDVERWVEIEQQVEMVRAKRR